MKNIILTLRDSFLELKESVQYIIYLIISIGILISFALCGYFVYSYISILAVGYFACVLYQLREDLVEFLHGMKVALLKNRRDTVYFDISKNFPLEMSLITLESYDDLLWYYDWLKNGVIAYQPAHLGQFHMKLADEYKLLERIINTNEEVKQGKYKNYLNNSD